MAMPTSYKVIARRRSWQPVVIHGRATSHPSKCHGPPWECHGRSWQPIFIHGHHERLWRFMVTYGNSTGNHHGKAMVAHGTTWHCHAYTWHQHDAEMVAQGNLHANPRHCHGRPLSSAAPPWHCHGRPWSSVDTHEIVIGCHKRSWQPMTVPWSPMATDGGSWQPITLPWSPMATDDCSWQPMALADGNPLHCHGRQWPSLDIHSSVIGGHPWSSMRTS